MNALEFNKKCARFLNVEIVQRNEEDAVYMFENAAFPEYFRCTKWNTFHEDWNLLMKVITNIEEVSNNTNIINWSRQNNTIFDLKLTEATKEKVLEKVNEFLDWYNLNK